MCWSRKQLRKRKNEWYWNLFLTPLKFLARLTFQIAITTWCLHARQNPISQQTRSALSCCWSAFENLCLAMFVRTWCLRFTFGQKEYRMAVGLQNKWQWKFLPLCEWFATPESWLEAGVKFKYYDLVHP